MHVGMATTRNFYALECQAHRDGYDKEDVNGKTLTGDIFWKEEYEAPEVLKTKFDCEQVLNRWKKGLTVSSVYAIFLFSFERVR
jgi:pyroglutamyl-peptidase